MWSVGWLNCVGFGEFRVVSVWGGLGWFRVVKVENLSKMGGCTQFGLLCGVFLAGFFFFPAKAPRNLKFLHSSMFLALYKDNSAQE